jgi:hypothetical protein
MIASEGRWRGPGCQPRAAIETRVGISVAGQRPLRAFWPRLRRGNLLPLATSQLRMKLAAPLLLVIALGATACLGSSSASSTTNEQDATVNGAVPAGILTVTVRMLPGRCALGVGRPGCGTANAAVRHYSLTCGPSGGSMPNPARACDAITDYLRRQDRPGGCLGVDRSPGSTADLTGTFGHRPFSLKLETGYSWCGRPQPVLRDLWILSTLPCSADTDVFREAGAHLARAIGCKK